MISLFTFSALTTIIIITAIIIASYYVKKAKSKFKEHNLHHLKNAEEAETIHQAQLDQLTTQCQTRFFEAFEILQNERGRIANEFHDDIIQRLVAMRFRLEQLLYFTLRPEVEQEINLLRGELENTIGDFRYVIRNLKHPKIEGKDINYLISEMINKLKLITSIKFDLNIQNSEHIFRIPGEVTKELYLLSKEAVQNALKHSAGLEIKVSLTWKPEDLTIEITNDGVIFLRSTKSNIGLDSMQQRCTKIGASFEKFNRPGKPFLAVVKFILPNPVLLSNQSVPVGISN